MDSTSDHIIQRFRATSKEKYMQLKEKQRGNNYVYDSLQRYNYDEECASSVPLTASAHEI